jgi:hypothetical protein
MLLDAKVAVLARHPSVSILSIKGGGSGFSFIQP